MHSLILETPSDDSGESKFLQGMPPTWNDLSAALDVPRDVTPEILKALQVKIHDGKNFTLELWHSPGSGGTTVALRVAWQLRTKHPVLVLRRYSRLTADRVAAERPLPWRGHAP